MITTAGKTNSEIVLEIFRALNKHGKQCLNEDGDCAYGDGHGNHCGIGMLLEEGSIMSVDLPVDDLVSGYYLVGINRDWINDNIWLCSQIPDHT